MIYKPTDLSPSAQTFDVMDTPIFFECKVDTSNVQASGFTIEILDSENNVVFSSIPKGEQLNINYITIIDDLREYVHTYFPDYEIGYSLLNTGYNGSYLKFPFSVAYDSKANNTNTSAINQIFYIPDPNGIVKGLTEDEEKVSSGLYRNNYIWTTGDNPEYIIDTNKPLIPVKIYNGKEYKWSITLYQLDNVGTTKNPVWILPENPLIFDMPITTGAVLGSNNKRIQSAFSEEIYGGYFIQPLWIEGLNYNAGEEDIWTYEKLSNSEEWDKSIIYNINNYVKVINKDTNTEKYYKCIKQTDSNIEITNTEYWKEVEQISQIGSRVAIKSYDMSFGYIYPVEGDNGFQTGTIKNDVSNAFRIYKNGNNSENLTVYQKVNFVANKALDDVTAIEWTIDGRALGDGAYGYKKGDVVLYNNNVYQCEKEYNSSAISHIPGKNDTYWELVSENPVEQWVDGKNMEYCRLNSGIYKRRNKIPYIYPELISDKISSFDSSTIYNIGDIVKNTTNNITRYYKCIKQTSSGIGITNKEYWEGITSSPYWSKKNGSILNFSLSTLYFVGLFVKNNNKYYKCIKVAINKETTNTEYWKEITFNEYKNYSIEDVVGYNDSIYSCIKEINQTPVNGSAYWNLISYKNISYNQNDIVGYVDKLYKCKQTYNINNPIFNTEPSLYGYEQNPSIDDNKSMYWSMYNGQVWEWNESLANQGESYGTFTYYSSTDPNGVYTLPNGIMPKTIIGGERIVLNSQLTGASYTNKNEYLGSPYNGIYTTDVSSQHSYEEYNASNTYKYGDIVLYEGSIYCCTGVVKDVEPGVSDNWSRYWIGTQFSNNAAHYDSNRTYKKDDMVQIFTGKDEDGNEIYSYYTCLGTVLGQAPSSESSTYWVKNDRNGYRVTIRFNRAPDADSWGELMTKIVYVSGGNTFYGKNIQIKAPNEDGTIDTSDGYGVINQTPFKFIEEEPVEIYKYSFDEYDNSKLYKVGDVILYNNKKYMCIKNTITDINISNTEYWEDRTNDIINTTGLIFYNKSVTEDNKNGILYIRYFDGIQKGMMLQKLSNDNKYQYFIIDDVGTNGGMYLKYHEVKEFDTYKPYTTSDTVENANPITLTADTTWDIDETKYQIKTYFRESDENAFYFYSRPEIDIQFKNTNGVNFTTDRTPLVEAYEWEEGRIYGAGDYVYKDTETSEPYTRTYYLCLVNNVKDIDPSDATASAGKWLNTGTDGIRNYEYALYYVSGVEYKIGDYVYLSTDDKITYYKCLKDKTTDAPNKTGGTSDWLEVPLDINYKKDTIVKYTDGVYYIALTNISQLAEPIKPEKENLGIFWEPYVGVLFREDIGFTYSLYSDLKVYNKGSVVYNEGKYYYTKKDITSVQPPVIYEENKNYDIGDIVWRDINGDILYYKATREINQTGQSIFPENDVTGSWISYDNFSNFIWNPYTNVQLKDEKGDFIKYYNGWTVVYKGVTYECTTSNEAGIEPSIDDTIDSFMSNGNWIKYNKLDGDEIFIDGIRYNKNNTIYTEFNPREMYLLNRVIYCDGIQYKVTFTVLKYNAETEYKKGDYVLYDVDGVGIYEYYICISDEPIKGKAPVLKYPNNYKELNDNYWATTVINTLPKITDEEYFGKYVSWVNTKLYNHGDIVLYNDVFYVYINENSQRMSTYNNTTNYEIGDLVRYKESDDSMYKWQFYAGSDLGNPILCDIIPEKDGTYPRDYDSSKYWIPYYGFMYYGDYNDGVSIGREYYYNNVVKFNNQYYIYVNPNISNTSLSPDQISLTRLKEDIREFKGEKKYSVGDIVLYNDKYYIYYKDAGDWLYSPANADYWTLFPWQIFTSQIRERTIVCDAEYEQQQYIQWKSVQWFLCDDSGENILDKSEVIYDGDLTYTFHGVDGRERGTDKPVYFIIRLILETRTGYRMTVERKIEAIYEIEEIDSEGLISAYFDCDTMSIVTEVTKESGFIIPTISEIGTTITYSDGESHENGVMSIEGEVSYEKVLYSLESVSDIASAKDITSESERFEMMGSHTIDTDRFSGIIVSMASSVANAITEEVQPKGYFKIYLSELLSKNTNYSKDTELSREEIIVVNSDRNILKWEATDVNGQVPFEGVVEIRDVSKSDGNTIGITEGKSETGDLSLFFTPQDYITCSNWQPKSFSYTKYPYANYLPITYASCINSHSDAEQVSFNQYRNVRKTLNLYEKEIIMPHFNDDGTINCSLNKDFAYPCKRVQEPIMSISDNFKTDENFGNANKINSTIFGLSENMLNTEGATNEIYIVGSAPTLCSDFAYKETYGVYEGKDSSGIYVRKKNVMQDFSYAFSDESFDVGVGPENNIWNNNSNIWVDGDFIINGEYINYNIGELSINNSVVHSYELQNGSIIKDGAHIEEVPKEDSSRIFSDSQLGYQKPLTENDKEITEGGIEIDVITERGYLKGKTLIVDAELMMDGDGGITPYPIGSDPSATPEKLVVYVDPSANFKPPKN